MDDDGTQILKTGFDALLTPIQDILAKLVGPWSEEVGLAFGDWARVYRLKQALKLLERVRTITEEAGFEPQAVKPKILLPILECASIEDDDGLHERWAALLANAAAPERDFEIIPGHAEVLKQLKSYEVKFLDRVYDAWESREPGVKAVAMDSRGALHIGDSKAVEKFGSGISELAKFPTCRLMMENFVRLGLFNHDENLAQIFNLQKHPIDTNWFMTEFGFVFVRACRPPHKPREH